MLVTRDDDAMLYEPLDSLTSDSLERPTGSSLLIIEGRVEDNESVSALSTSPVVDLILLLVLIILRVAPIPLLDGLVDLHGWDENIRGDATVLWSLSSDHIFGVSMVYALLEG